MPQYFFYQNRAALDAAAAAAANHQRMLPGSLFPVYMNETGAGTIQAQVPGAGYINEKATT